MFLILNKSHGALILWIITIFCFDATYAFAGQWKTLATVHSTSSDDEEGIEIEIDGPPFESKAECKQKATELAKEVASDGVKLDAYCVKVN